MAKLQVAPPGRGAASAPASPARWLMLALLVLIYTLNYIDRQIVVILQEPIRAEFHLEDWQLGLLTGASISILYTAVGIPVARWVDRGVHRVTLLASITALWSLMTAVCGISGSFLQFVVARMGVGLAEAGFAPASHSLLSDLFPPKQRPFAMGVFALGVPIGIMVGLASGGIIAQMYGWRMALLVVGLPGLGVALLFALLAKEPVRGASDPVGQHPVARMDFATACRELWNTPAYVRTVLASATSAFSMTGLMAWMPSFLVRVHGLTLGEAGLSLGVIVGVAGFFGTVIGGWQASRMGVRGMHAALWIPIAGFALAGPLFVAALLAWDARVAIVLLILPIGLGHLWTAPSIALTQSLAPVAARATASAVYIVTSNLIGVALAPVAVGFASDRLARLTGNAATGLRWAMVGCAMTMVVGVIYWALASRALKRSGHGVIGPVIGGRDAAATGLDTA